MTQDPAQPPQYLQPYLRAARAYGAGFGSLLWASPETQAVRFDAITEVATLAGKSILDVGCGRADLLSHLLNLGIRPADYVGIEAVDTLASAAKSKLLPNCSILSADFVAEPLRMFVGADVVIFSGSLNTVDDATFYTTIRHAYEAATEALVFNFLDSPRLAGQPHLYFREPRVVRAFCERLSPTPRRVKTLDDYLPGDTTLCITQGREG